MCEYFLIIVLNHRLFCDHRLMSKKKVMTNQEQAETQYIFHEQQLVLMGC